MYYDATSKVNGITRKTEDSGGGGYPKSEVARKLRDTALLKRIRRSSQIGFAELLNSLEDAFIEKLMQKRDVIDFVLKYGSGEAAEWLKVRTGSDLC